MDTNNLISQAERHYKEGDHGEAVAKLTTAARSNPDEQQMSSIESMIRKIGEHVLGNSNEGAQDRGMGSMMKNSLFSSNNGSSQVQLGKLALLATVLTTTSKSNGGQFNLGSLSSVFGGNKQNQNGMGSSGLSSLANQFFGSGNNQQQQQHQQQNSGTFSGLAAMASSFMSGQNQGQGYSNQGQGYSNQNNNSQMYNQRHGSENHDQQGYNNNQGYNNQGYNNNPQFGSGNQGKPNNQESSTLGSLASMAGSFLSHGQGQGQQQQQQHQSSTLGSLASMASQYLGGDNKNQQQQQQQQQQGGNFNFEGNFSRR